MPITVLIAARRGRGELLESILRAEPDIEVTDFVQSAHDAVERAATSHPAVLVVDVDLDPAAAIQEVLRSCQTRVLLFAPRRSDSQKRCMQAMAAGALSVLRDVAEAPAVVKSAAERRAATERRAGEPRSAEGASGKPSAPAPSGGEGGAAKAAGERALRVVAVGCSVGGPGALHEILSALPADFAAPLLVAQHLAEGFIDGLATWLDGASRLTVKVARQGEKLIPGRVYLAPHDRHLTVHGERIALSDAPPREGFRPAASVLFEGVADAFGARAIGVILTGLGSDGVAGLRALRSAGGHVLAQDERTSAAFGMPGAAIEAGVCDAVLPVDRIAAHLQERLR